LNSKSPSPKHKVILTDDHGILRAGLKELLLKDSQLDVVAEFSNADDLLIGLKTIDCDIIILDISMPGMDSLKALLRIKSKYSTIKIIMLTMHKNKSLVKQALANGADGYILKDELSEKLIQGIKTVLKGNQFISTDLMNGIIKDFSNSPDNYLLTNKLTKREKEVLKLVVQGNTSNGIAQEFDISPRTVEHHRSNIRKKLEINDLAGLVKYARENNLVGSG